MKLFIIIALLFIGCNKKELTNAEVIKLKNECLNADMDYVIYYDRSDVVCQKPEGNIRILRLISGTCE